MARYARGRCPYRRGHARGAQAVVTGVSGRGTQTRDTFSLLGFTASVEEAQRRCAG